MENGQYDQAEEALTACLKVDQRNHDAILNLGVTQMRRKAWDKGLNVFSKLVKAYPKSFLGYRNAGNCFAHMKKFKEAASCFEKALRIFPDYNEARIDLGVVCFAGGRPDLAEKILAEAKRRDPTSLRSQAILDEIAKAKKAASQKKK
jgi:tetratricopeptide (TPR) repeat protein